MYNFFIFEKQKMGIKDGISVLELDYSFYVLKHKWRHLQHSVYGRDLKQAGSELYVRVLEEGEKGFC